MKFRKNITFNHKQYNHHVNQFYYSFHAWEMYHSPHDIFGPIYVNAYTASTPYGRDKLSADLGVRVELIKEIAHKLRLPDGTRCKPNWFDDNCVVLCDPDHRTAVSLEWTRINSGLVYPSPSARPQGGMPITVFQPDIKGGNACLARLKPLIGEARLRAGILGVTQSLSSSILDQLATGNEVDLSAKQVVACLIHSDLSVYIRERTRKKSVLKELVYEP